MSLFEYLPNLPKIPKELIGEVFNTIEGKDLFHITNDIYKIYDANEELKKFLSNTFDRSIYNLRVHVMYADVKIHVDHNRDVAFNYLVKTGGPNVETLFHNENDDVIEKITIKPLIWHKLQVTNKHSVKNIKSPRIAITVHIPHNKK